MKRQLPDWARYPDPPRVRALPNLAVAKDSDDPIRQFYLRRLAGGVLRGLYAMRPVLDPSTLTASIWLEDAICALPTAQRLRAVDHPFVHYEWFKIMEAFSEGGINELGMRIHKFGRHFVLPTLTGGGADALHLPVWLNHGELRFSGHAVHLLQLPDPDYSGPAVLRGDGNGVDISLSGGRMRVSVYELVSADAPTGSHSVTRRRALVPGSPIELDSSDDCVEELFCSINSKPAEPGAPITNLEPFGAVSVEVKDDFAAALGLIQASDPEMAQELPIYTKIIIPFRSPGTSSFTENAFMGAVFLSESLRPFSSALYTAEHLLHEHSHLRLALVMELDDLSHSHDESRFASPWRRDPRPLLGLIQGAFVFARLSKFMRLAHKATGNADFSARREQINRDLEAALVVLRGRGVVHTALGHSLLDQYESELNLAC